MAFRFRESTDLLETLQQHEDLARERFQHLCNQFHEVLERLPGGPLDEIEKLALETVACEKRLASRGDPIQDETGEVNTVPQQESADAILERNDVAWTERLLGRKLTANEDLAGARNALVAGLAQLDRRAMALVGWLLLVRAAPAERYPQVFKDVGEAYYGWRAAGGDAEGNFEQALIEWLREMCAQAGLANSIERVQAGDRFDPVRHQAPQPGVEVAGVQGWVVLRDGGKVYTRAAVTAR